MSYREDKKGQILEEGINEAGALCSWTAAGTAYANHGLHMVPFYIFYSMFGFQRVGDLIWQAADIRTRGFLMGATAGRTTLLGEGLQHQDGHSLVLASTVPAVQAYDPAFAYEVGAIVKAGIDRMYGKDSRENGGELDPDVIYYITLYNENYPMPALPEGREAEVEAGAVRGLYRFADAPEGPSKRATILFSGISHAAAGEAAAELAEHYDVAAELWSATSYKRLREEALAAERQNRLHPSQHTRVPLVTQLLAESAGPITAVSDFMKVVPEQVARFVPEGRPFHVLGTDGMGRSDTREALRRFFEIDTGHVVVAVLTGLMEAGEVDASVVEDAIRRYDIDPDAVDPYLV
jgi:pyruvate dehydrogenase E1 component